MILRSIGKPVIREGHRSDIEGLRAISILLVVAYHSGFSLFSGGFIGVDVFFVISGYVITATIVKEIEKTGTFSFVSFYSRRAKRLLPAAVLMTAGTVIFSFAFLSPLATKEITKSAIAALSFTSNMWFAVLSSNYFGPNTAENPLIHTWTLSVEEQFYLFWPLLIFFSIKFLAKKRHHISLIITVSIVSLVACIALTPTAQPWAFFSMPTRAWQFGVGAATFLLPNIVPHGLRSRVLSWTGLALILATATVIDSTSPFPGYLATLPTFGAALVMSCGRTGVTKGVGRLLSLLPFQFVGRLSYSWYLWHWPFLVYSNHVLHLTHISQIVAADGLSFVTAVISFNLVENPIRFNPFFVRKSLVTLISSAVMSTTFISMTYATYRMSREALLSPSQKRIQDSRVIPQKYERCIVGLWDSGSTLKTCTFGNPDASLKFVLFGDSHAWQWLPALETDIKRSGASLVTLVRSSCPTADVPDFYYPKLRREYSECRVWRSAAINRIKELKPNFVIVSNSYYYERLGISAKSWQVAQRKVLQRLTQFRARVVVIRDNPAPWKDLDDCLSAEVWHHRPESLCSFSRTTPFNETLFSADKDVANSITGVYLIDLSKKICPHKRCRPTENGLVKYRDSNHLSYAYVKSMANVLYSHLNPIIAKRFTVSLKH